MVSKVIKVKVLKPLILKEKTRFLHGSDSRQQLSETIDFTRFFEGSKSKSNQQSNQTYVRLKILRKENFVRMILKQNRKH